MSANDSSMPLSEDTKTPQVYKLEIKEANYNVNKNEMNISIPVNSIGLTKEELDSFSNDPFWKVFRSVMFVLFWVAWGLMFIAAILLIVLSPKCAVEKEPEWWRRHVSYQ
ncbi:unnamed protein product, partial [Onchocerca ochengi]|uniref:SLC3A2_N domain-containing protein n=1 Tax=Onchocerca ochengi TaxID=42157 RepID=A0A182EW11_ONCOC